jgi:hypothetical protein
MDHNVDGASKGKNRFSFPEAEISNLLHSDLYLGISCGSRVNSS